MPRLFDTEEDAKSAFFLADGDAGFDNLSASEKAERAARRTMEPAKFYTTYG